MPWPTWPSAQGRVAEIGTGLPAAPAEVDVAGLVVTAGFVDLHSHVDDLAGLRLQALDGVTTALELEAGASPVAAAYRTVAAEGRPINYGFAAVLGAGPDDARSPGSRRAARWPISWAASATPAGSARPTPAQLAALLARLAGDLADGALGIGLLLGYAPGRRPGGVPAGGRAGRRGGRADLHARPGPDRDGPGRGHRRRRGDRAGGRPDRRAHALLPREQHLAAAYRPGARPGRAGPRRPGRASAPRPIPTGPA